MRASLHLWRRETKREIHRALLADAAANQSLAQMRELNDLFIGIDSDGDGVITADEVRSCLANKWSAGDIDRLINVLIGESGEVAYDEFMGQLMSIRGPQEKELLQDIFNDADSDKNGYLTIKEIQVLLKRPAISKVLGNNVRNEDVMRFMDREGKGYVTFDDFLRAIYGDSRAADPKSLPTYKVGQEVEYYSSSFSIWMPCEVSRVDEQTGAIQINAKPDFWMNTVEAQKRVRPLRSQGTDSTSTQGQSDDGTGTTGFRSMMNRAKAAGLGRQMLSGAMFGGKRSGDRKSTWEGDGGTGSKDLVDDMKGGLKRMNKNMRALFFG